MPSPYSGHTYRAIPQWNGFNITLAASSNPSLNEKQIDTNTESGQDSATTANAFRSRATSTNPIPSDLIRGSRVVENAVEKLIHGTQANRSVVNLEHQNYSGLIHHPSSNSPEPSCTTAFLDFSAKPNSQRLGGALRDESIISPSQLSNPSSDAFKHTPGLFSSSELSYQSLGSSVHSKNATRLSGSDPLASDPEAFGNISMSSGRGFINPETLRGSRQLRPQLDSVSNSSGQGYSYSYHLSQPNTSSPKAHSQTRVAPASADIEHFNQDLIHHQNIITPSPPACSNSSPSLAGQSQLPGTQEIPIQPSTGNYISPISPSISTFFTSSGSTPINHFTQPAQRINPSEPLNLMNPSAPPLPQSSSTSPQALGGYPDHSFVKHKKFRLSGSQNQSSPHALTSGAKSFALKTSPIKSPNSTKPAPLNPAALQALDARNLLVADSVKHCEKPYFQLQERLETVENHPCFSTNQAGSQVTIFTSENIASMRKNNPDFSSDTKPSNSLSCAGGSQLTNPVNEIAQGAVTTKTALTTQGNRFARKSVAKRYFLSAKCKARARNSSSRNAQISPITPKPRPKLPEELTSGFPLRQPTLGHDPTQPKTLETDGLRFEKKEAVAWPRRGDAAHRVQFLLNPILNPGKNPAEDNIPDFTPPPSESPSRSPRTRTLGTIEDEIEQQMSPFAGYSSDQDEAQRLSTELRTVYIPGTDPNKLEPRTINTSHDLIGSGKISKSQAEKYWSIFFQNYSNRLTWSSQESQQMETIRSASDLVLSAILSVSSKALKKQTQTNAFFCEATTLIRCTMFPERDYNYEDLKGIMTVAIYHGLHSVCGHFVSLCLVLKLHKVFVKLTDVNLRGTATEEELVEKGRTWLLVVIYSHMFCVFSKKMYLIRSPQKVITDHAKILMSSKCSKDCDRLIEAHVELVVILANAQDKLDVRNYPGPVEQRRSNYVVPELFVVLQSLDDWYEEWRFRAPELFVFETRSENKNPQTIKFDSVSSRVGLSKSSIDSTIDRGFAKSLRNPQQYVYMYLMHAAVWPCQDGKIILQDRLRLHWAIEGCKYAERILETALELKESTVALQKEVEANCQSKGELYKNPRIEDAYHVETRSLPFRVEYEKVTLGLVTGYLLWICQVIPGYIELRDYRQLLGRLHSIDFHDSCEYIDLIEESISRIDEILGYQLQAQEESENNGLRKEAPLVNGKNGAGENFGGEREDQESCLIKTVGANKLIPQSESSDDEDLTNCSQRTAQKRFLRRKAGEYWIKEGIGVIEDRMANELERLMTDTRFWFQIDIDVEF